MNNFLLLEKIAQTGKPVILSSGMSSLEELDQAVAFLLSKEVAFSILQCTTSYPTTPEGYGLNVIEELKDRYMVSVGFSDHSADIGTCIAATALGAEILEFHAVFNHSDFGPDATSSIEIDEVSQLVRSVRKVALSRKHPIDKTNNNQYAELKRIFEKSLAVNKDLKKGHILTFNDLEAKKPKGYGIDAAQFEHIIGRPLKKSLQQWDFLTEDDIAYE